jgi:DNA-binding beta-propeller fold protein YncE
MKPTQTIAKSVPTPNTGLFATLCAVFHVKGSGARKIGGGTGLFVVAVVGLFVFMAAPAFATGGHVFSSSFGTKGTGHGQFEDPSGVAVNNATGNVYVVDKGNNRVEEFSAEGAFVAEFNGSGTAGELSEPEAIAIDNSGETVAEDPSVGDLYVTDNNVVDKFSATGEYKGQITEAEGAAFQPLDGVAVDPKGQVWVYQKSVEIEEIDYTYIDAFSDAEANAFLSSRQSKAGGEAHPGLAVDSEDDFYVAHGEESPTIAKLNSAGTVLQPQGQNLGGTGRKTGVAVDPSSNDVYLDSAPSEEEEEEGKHPKVDIQEFAPDGEPVEAFGEAQLKPDRGGTALAVSYAPVSSGDVYVVDSTAGEVDVFATPKVAVHAFSLSFTGGPGHALSEPEGVAVNDETEDVYVVDKGNKRVEEFTKAGVFIAAFNGAATPTGAFYEPEAIAVDNCKNGLGEPCSKLEDPSVGDVYVTEHLPQGNEPEYANPYAVYKFSSTGAYLGQLRRCPEDEVLDGVCEPAGRPTAGFSESVNGVTVSPEGDVWVGYSHGFEGSLSYEFSDTGTFIESPTSSAPGPGIDAGFSALDPSTGELFVDRESSIDRYASGEESPEGLSETFPNPGGLQDSHGITVSPAGMIYATERTANDVEVFDEYPLAQVAVGAVAGLRPTSVTLRGSVNPEGAKVGACEFEYGTTTSYGLIAECEPAAGSLGEGTEPKLVDAKVSGLPSGTTYHYRLLASDAHGTNRSADHTFTTPGPTISEERVSGVEASAATLQATIDPNGSATSYHFEYDTSPYTSAAAHGTSVPIPNAAIGSGRSAVPVSVRVTGLEPGTVYYYRVVAEGEPLGAPEAFYGLDKTFTTNPGSGGGRGSESCANEQRRIEQPYGTTLPDCRAYEMVSPLNTNGQDATEPNIETTPRSSVTGEAITYASRGGFENPAGSELQNQYLARRGAQGWSTQSITPPHHAYRTETAAPYKGAAFTPDLTSGIASSNVSLTDGAPEGTEEFGLYVHELASDAYRYVGLPTGEFSGITTGEFSAPMGASTDLSHVVFGEGGTISEWVNGDVTPVSVSNNGESIAASVGTQYETEDHLNKKDAWHAVSAKGARVYFTSPGDQEGTHTETTVGALYVRDNAEQPQSALASPEANATGTLAKGFTTVTELAATPDAQAVAKITAGSAEVTLEKLQENEGREGLSFSPGQSITGQGIPEGATITNVSHSTITISAPATESNDGAGIVSYRADPFAVGQGISGYGIPPGATIKTVTPTVAPTELTLSVPAAVSGSAVALNAGGECTEPARACTLDISASRRTAPDTHGPQSARYWGAGAEGEKVFFTSKEELTEDAYTGPADNEPNLYEYDFDRPAGERLKDLTVDTADVDGAAVQGVVQISEEGSYVYFVARGVLTGAGGAPLSNSAGEAPLAEAENLYVSHAGGALSFVANLAAGDRSDWAPYTVADKILKVEEDQAGPITTTAVVTPSGGQLAFISERSLPSTNFPNGYDNEQAEKGDCEGKAGIEEHETGACREIYLYDAETAETVCASCDPSGQRPAGPSSLSQPIDSRSLYRPRNLLEDGTLFFDSADALVPNSSDGQQNVYEYENGRIHAISNVAGGDESFFMDASANGENVFFGSADQLLREDAGDNVVVWDARVDGGFPVTAAAPSCDNADSCKPPEAPQPAIFGSPASATFSGPGNTTPGAPAVVTPKKKTAAELEAEKLAKALKTCRKDKKKSERAKCEKQARSKYGPTKKKAKAKKSSNDRRASQ